METRYAYVARVLTEAIAEGRHPVGSVLPNELDLADQFAVSRSTIRAAMRELQASGLVSRRKSAGTRVEAARPARHGGGFVQTLFSVESVQQFGFETERRIQDVADVVADDVLAAQLGCRPGSRWLRISSVRCLPDDVSAPPICWTDVYVDDSYGETMRPRVRSYPGIFGTLLEEVSGRRISEIHQDIKAVGVPARVAGALKAEAGAHALEIRRQYILSPGSMAEVSISIHPADRYSYATRLMRQQPAP
ncbi:GntR family transcriptional regulator [Aquabacter sp. CN5-332]|uniref:GntR family transcriptional regulator n=1 Tax=Aquabacter sp. CN5-332 TaxID=3156608 RepID=UPI0032B611C2